MLFNSYPFLFGFLPVALGLHWLVERSRPDLRIPTLVALSFVFYAYWDWRFLPLLAASIGLNWLVVRLCPDAGLRRVVPLAIAVDLAVLGLFKYADLALGLAALAPGLAPPKLDWALPLGISFFTFHHVMYLTDLRAGRAPRYGLAGYAFYIAFFPQVLAGPLVRWSEVMHQAGERPYARPDAAERFGRGLMLFTIGLAKKVLLGDPLATSTNPVFQAAADGRAVTTIDAWQGVLGFTFQIYFDFSGYTDMALGLALLFGFVLPQNFDVPYRAASLQDFWRRWHMTLSRFLRDYLYVSLGGNRRGLAVQLAALLATMALGGLWHGAGLTFVAWGVAHGLGLGAGLLWRRAGLRLPRVLGRDLFGWAATFLFVALTWVLFRAGSFQAALAIYKALLGFAPTGSGFRWRTVALAAAVALVGPSAWAAVHALPPRRWLAVAAAVVLAIVILKVGDEAGYEFIYFQF